MLSYQLDSIGIVKQRASHIVALFTCLFLRKRYLFWFWQLNLSM